LNTLPEWCLSERRDPEVVRKVIRRRPDLQKLGTKYGATKVYTADEWALISAAMKERDAKLRDRPPAPQTEPRSR
jgi:hypothetical protein